MENNNVQQVDYQIPVEQKPKKRGCLIAFFIVLGVFILAGAVAAPFIIKEVKYASAEALVEANEFDNAVVMFESLGSYKDSAEQIANTRYLQAKYYAENEDYESAIEILKEIDSSEDAEELLGEYVISFLDALAEENDYDGIRKCLKTAKDINGSDEFEETCGYYQAIIDYLDKNYKDAAKALMELDGFKEAEKYYAMAAHKYYEESNEMIDPDETLESLFTKLVKYKDDLRVEALFYSHIYDVIKIMGEWKCTTGNESMFFSEDEVRINLPVNVARNKNYIINIYNGGVYAIDADTQESVQLFVIDEFIEHDVLNPAQMRIFNSANQKSYTFVRVK